MAAVYARVRAGVVGSCIFLSLFINAADIHSAPTEPGLLFYLSGDHGLTADYSAGGTPGPTFASDVRTITDGARNGGIECGHTQLLAYRAPGNIYAARGTLSFFWRSREPVGPTPFPVFRVGYADHSSWDMVWLRIDYNGAGFDAFVTDASLARTRVSYRIPSFPGPSTWTHLALAWDETDGIHFFVNGQEVAQQRARARFDAALDQFGPHSRTISPMQVQSAYNFVRGGDIDEVRVYDRALSKERVAALARGDSAGSMSALAVSPDAAAVRDEWRFRYGWNRPGDNPPALGARAVTIRKVEIHDAIDVKRWWWKGTDGIRETTWPGVYNRSRLPGRNDYFQLPDWDCYSTSGKAITLKIPDEPWNQVEISGDAGGRAIDERGRRLLTRSAGEERTFHRMTSVQRGGAITFENAQQESPIGELGVYYVAPGREPEGIARLTYRLTSADPEPYPALRSLTEFIAGRFQPFERATVVALPSGAPGSPAARAPSGGSHTRPAIPGAGNPDALSIVHVLIPSDFRDVTLGGPRVTFSYGWMNLDGGLDGIALDLPPLGIQPNESGLIPLNVQIKDPLWPLRNLLDVSFSVKPGEPYTIYFDTRDRVLPNGKSLYLSLASAAPGFGAGSLEGAQLRLVFKPRNDAAREHVIDRFTQVRDNFANIIEERPNNRRFDLYNRFEADLTDLLRVDPGHRRGREYWYEYNREQPRPAVSFEPVPPGVPPWAVRQVENLRYLKRLVNWYIDKRQIENGEFGGGLSDDGDLTNMWPGAAFMGVNPAKLTSSVLREMEAYYDQGLFTNGLPTIQTDELHSYEEGIQVLGQALLVDYGSPRQLERAMETARGIERLTGINSAGHRHIRSSYFNGTTIAEEGVWGWSKPSSYLILQPAMALVDFNGSPSVRRWLLELADSLLAHRKPDANGTLSIRATVEYSTDSDLPQPSERALPLLWAAFRWTGDRKYLQPFIDMGPRSLAQISGNALDLADLRGGWAGRIPEAIGPRRDDPLRHFAWQVSGDTRHLEDLYSEQIAAAAVREYINTEGSLWIDRVTANDAELQRARLGGIALVRNATYPGHAVSWRFDEPDAEEQVAILVPESTLRHLKIQAYNLAKAPVSARLTAWAIAPGTWEMDGMPGTHTMELQKGSEMLVVFPPGRLSTIELNLVREATPYWNRPDLGIGPGDVRVQGEGLAVTVHSLGAVDAPPSRLVLRDGAGKTITTADVPALPAPHDLQPKTATITLRLPAGISAERATVVLENRGSIPEITQLNNRVTVRASPARP